MNGPALIEMLGNLLRDFNGEYMAVSSIKLIQVPTTDWRPDRFQKGSSITVEPLNVTC